MVFASCVPEEKPVVVEEKLPIVRTVAASEITATSVVITGFIEEDGNAEITSKGFCWSQTTYSPGISDSVVVSSGENTFSDSIRLAPAETYYIRAFAVNTVGVAYGKVLKVKALGSLPKIESVIVDCTTESATIMAKIDGGDLPTQVTLSHGPTNAYGQSIEIGESDTIDVEILGLNYSTKYYYSITAKNSLGETSFTGNFTTKNPTMTDIDGNVYQSVKIGDQIWLAENLKVTHYNDGTPILNPIEDEDWIKAGEDGIGAYCYYNNDPEIGKIYGPLYNWYTINTGKLAPEGWHVPTNAEWKKLNVALAIMIDRDASGIAFREAGTEHWTSPNEANNASGFTALGGGWRGNSKQGIFCFGDLLSSGVWWAADEMRPGVSFVAWTDHDSRYLITSNSASNTHGESIRLVKD